MPTDAENAAKARTAICGSDSKYVSTYHDNLRVACENLVAKFTAAGVTPPPPHGGTAGPYFTVAKPSDDVNQQTASRFPAFGTYMTVAELISYVASLIGNASLNVNEAGTPNIQANYYCNGG